MPRFGLDSIWTPDPVQTERGGEPLSLQGQHPSGGGAEPEVKVGRATDDTFEPHLNVKFTPVHLRPGKPEAFSQSKATLQPGKRAQSRDGEVCDLGRLPRAR